MDVFGNVAKLLLIVTIVETSFFVQGSGVTDLDDLSYVIQGSSASAWAAENLEKQVKGECESASGPGSSMLNTVVMRRFLSSVIQSYSIRTISDVGCGDWNWMKTVDFVGHGINYYTGYDISKDLVEMNAKSYGNQRVQFRQWNILTQVPGQADLVLVRDLLFHLSNAHILQALRMICKSGSRVLITTTFPLLHENSDLSARRRMAAGTGQITIQTEMTCILWLLSKMRLKHSA